MSENKEQVSSVESSPQNMLTNQDFIQKLSMAPTIAVELYKVMVSSFLVLFVPQKCGDHVCQLNENLVLDNELYNTAIVLNFITMFSFLMFYFIEVKRENRLITYLEVNSKKPFDNDSVEKVLELLPVEKRGNILRLDTYYQKMGYFVLFMFLLNSIVSGCVVYEYYLDNQTTSTYITNILFMITKLSDIYATVNTDKNIFYSAYLKGKIQYNDVDPDKLLQIESKKDEVVEEKEFIQEQVKEAEIEMKQIEMEQQDDKEGENTV
jgi:hypothetical protein